MSSESGDEDVVTNDNGQSAMAPGDTAGSSTSPVGGIQEQIQDLNRLRDELTRLRDETRANRAPTSAPTHSFVYIPRERHIQAFSGEYGKDGRTVEEFIEEVERVLRTREQSREEHCDFILSLLRGPALEEVRLCMGGQSVETSDLYSYLRNAFGERRSATQLLQTFYNRRQADGEDLRDYSHALSQLLNSVVKQSSEAVPNERVVLRDQFIEGLRDATLRRELRKMARDKPESSILDIRNEALQWQMEDARSNYPRVTKSRQIQSEINEAQCSVATTEHDQHTILDQVQKAVARQDKQMMELTKMLADLTSTVKDLTTCSTLPSISEPKQRARLQPKFTQDGKPICFKCNGVGHIAKKCLQSRRRQDETSADPSVAPENSRPRL